MRTIRGYIWRSMRDMLRLSATYAPLRAYLAAATVPIAISFALGVRYLVLVSFVDPTRSHTPSLILLAIFGLLGFLIIALGMIGEMLSVNRRLLEELRLIERRRALKMGPSWAGSLTSSSADRRSAQTPTTKTWVSGLDRHRSEPETIGPARS